MVNLGQILEKSTAVRARVGQLITTHPSSRMPSSACKKLDKATEGLEDQGPLSVLGIAVNSLF